MIQGHPKGIYLDRLTKIMEEFALAVDYGAVLVDIHGKETSNLFNFSPFCQTIRANPQLKHLCQKCDAYGGLEASKTGKPHIYQCHAGLTDISLPLIYDRQLHGFALFGQVQVADIKENQIDRIHPSITNWKDYAELRHARNKVRVVNKKQITAAASLFETIAEHYGKEEDHPRDRIKFNLSTPKEKTGKTKNKEGNSDHGEINKAIKYINKNLSRNITLDEVANHVYLSHYYFSRLFKKELGISFVNYLNKQRIEQAKELLLQTNLSVQKIAYRIGYTQPSYFCKLFKKETGTTPASFRRKS
ncbi:PocR ligand-binding domain-containing protein [Enterococcus sp. DIV1298c]|uniref:PocR ligand-binding domain-containing protein n=1 Tax=Enterococcus sp. DIV1298c TaxID=2815328 RepID=UPI001A936CC0|nr:PocR ligand-binding domain-containing protein [Enterococcus sp. DIV1298c]MBO0462005.1 PocR ligand-binding domain-containing protein [Enterococcus sp. DIV1298c]